MIPLKEGLCEHKQYPTTMHTRVIHVLMSDIDKAHIVPINRLGAKMLGLKDPSGDASSAHGHLASCHKMLRAQRPVEL